VTQKRARFYEITSSQPYKVGGGDIFEQQWRGSTLVEGEGEYGGLDKLVWIRGRPGRGEICVWGGSCEKRACRAQIQRIKAKRGGKKGEPEDRWGDVRPVDLAASSILFWVGRGDRR